MGKWLVLAVLAASLAGAPSAHAATTLLVDDDGHGTPSNCDAPDVSKTTIQEGVNAASNGDTIVVCAGTYPEKVTVNKSVTLLGAQAGVDARTRSVVGALEAVVRGAVSGANRTAAFNVTANNVTIDGFTAQETSDSAGEGFVVVLAPGTSGQTIRNNIIRDGIAGLSAGADSTVIQRNRFDDNNRSGPISGTGIYTDQFQAGGSLTNVTIDANSFTNNQNVGVLLGSTSAAQPESNITVSNNTFEGGGNGFLAFNLLTSSFTRNVLNATTASSVIIGGGVVGLPITENAISNGATRGIRIGDFGGGGTNSGLTITCNSITNSGTAGMELDLVGNTGPLNGSFNWWNAPSGPTIASNPGGTGDKLVDPNALVDYTPFLTDGTDADPATPGFQCTPKASVTDVTKPEGTGTTTGFDFTVTLNNPSPGPVSVQYATTDGTAKAGSDYTATSGTLTFASGEQSKTVTVAVTGDGRDEPDEAFTVRLSAPTGGTIGDGEGSGTITDDDSTPIVGLRVLKKKLGKALRRGLGVNLTTDEAGKASIVAKVKGRVVGRGKRTFTSGGTKRVTVKFTRAAKKRFGHAPRLKLTLVARVTDADGNTGRATKKLSLKR